MQVLRAEEVINCKSKMKAKVKRFLQNDNKFHKKEGRR